MSNTLDGINNSTRGIIRALVGDVTEGIIEADMKCLGDGSLTNAQIIFSYQDDQNYRFIDMREGGDKWRVREYIGGTRYDRATWSRNIATDQWYHVIVMLVTNGTVILDVDGTTIGSYQFASSTAGGVGAGVDQAHVQGIIYNLQGQKVRVLIDGKFSTGYHMTVWDGTDNNGNPVNSGPYFMKIKTGKHVHTLKLLLLR